MRLAALACVVAACSPATGPLEAPADASGDAGRDAALDATTDGGVACLFCTDATEDLPLAVAVEGEIDRVCSQANDCHGSGAGGMGLSPGHEFASMIDVTSYENPPMKRVLPGDPAQSYVYLKLACEGGIVGGCMPNYATHSDALAKLFHDWIEAGAPTE